MMLEPTYAAAPFDHVKADVILRTSDNIDFRVFKLFLSLASPFFETLFDIPQPTEASEEQEVKDGLAVIPVAEDSKTLDSLLRFCYPCTLTDDPKLEVLKDINDVLEAAKKYSLDAIEQKVRQAISTPEILEAEPLSCFAIAHRGCLRDETLLAAKATLTRPLIPSWFKEIELITTTDLLTLLTYHKSCGEAVYALRKDISWIKAYYGSEQRCAWLQGQYTYGDCRCSRSQPPKYQVFNRFQSLQWWEEFMDEVFSTLRDKPCKQIIAAVAERTVQSVKAKNCEACAPKVSEGMHDFTGLLERKVEEVVSQIDLELQF